MPADESPNWYWGRLGFTIHRDVFRRKVFDTRGHMVCDTVGYDSELSIAQWLYHGAVISPITTGD